MIARVASVLGAFVLSLSPASPAFALPLDPSEVLLTVSVDGVGNAMPLTAAMLGCEPSADDPNVYSCVGSGFVPADPNHEWMLNSWDLQFDLDPFVNQAFGFTNVGPDATFTLITSIPVAPIGPSSLIGGSTGGSVTDASNDGLGGMTTAAPDAFFSGLIDGVPVALGAADLHPDPFVLPAGGVFNFAGETQNIPADSFGLPGPTTVGPAVAASIGIRNRFTLSAGDSIASSNFFVVQIPEPGSGLLLGAALGALALLRRRR